MYSCIVRCIKRNAVNAFATRKLVRSHGMFITPEQLAATSKTNVETALRFTAIALESAERIFEVQMNAAKGALAQGAQQAKTLARAKDLPAMTELKRSFMQPGLETATTYVKSLYDVAATTQSEFSKLF